MSRILIIVMQEKDIDRAKLVLYELEKKEKRKIFETRAFIGRNGMTSNKEEGDGKTPEGQFELGIAFGTHKKEEIDEDIEYIEINENLYWVDDMKSKYYNQLVDITKVKKDWTTAEHLIEYPKQYEYAIEIKANPQNISGKGSAIFLHCSINSPTSGCVAIGREKMLEILKRLNKNSMIIIQKNQLGKIV